MAPLTPRFADPARQLPRVVAIALAVTTAIYLGLAVTTIAVLGPAAATDVPLAELLAKSVGSAGPAVAGVAAVVLTLGTANAYINGAVQMVTELRHGAGRPAAFLGVIGATGVVGLALYGLRLVSVADMVELPTVLFLAVYLGAMFAAVRLLRGAVRIVAVPAVLAVAGMLVLCGWAVALPVAVVVAVLSAGVRATGPRAARPARVLELAECGR